MEITQQVRDMAAQEGRTVEAVSGEGMKTMASEFRRSGSRIYPPA